MKPTQQEQAFKLLNYFIANEVAKITKINETISNLTTNASIIDYIAHKLDRFKVKIEDVTNYNINDFGDIVSSILIRAVVNAELELALTKNERDVVMNNMKIQPRLSERELYIDNVLIIDYKHLVEKIKKTIMENNNE